MPCPNFSSWPRCWIQAVGVPNGDPHGATVSGTFTKKAVQSGVRLVQEHSGIYKDVDSLPRHGQQINIGRHGYVGALGVQRYQFGADRASGTCLAEGRPERMDILPEGFGCE
jgi:hypothetical protein